MKYLKQILGNNIFIKKMLKTRYKLFFPAYLKKNIPLFVFQMGKVASSSVFYSLKEQYNGLCFHEHHFNPAIKVHTGIKHEVAYDVSLLYHQYNKKKFPIKIISMIREPIGRNLSAFFENFERETGIPFKNNTLAENELLDFFINNFSAHNVPLLWFDLHIKKHFNIDIYSEIFPKEGYKLYKNKNVELLVFKHDINDKIKEDIISTFTGINNFKLKIHNDSTNKNYSNIYKTIQKLKIPDFYIKKMLKSKYATHFYINEIESIRNKWIN